MTELLKAELFGFMLGDGWITTKHNCGFSGDPESLQIAKNDLIELMNFLKALTLCLKEQKCVLHTLQLILFRIHILRI